MRLSVPNIFFSFANECLGVLYAAWLYFCSDAARGVLTKPGNAAADGVRSQTHMLQTISTATGSVSWLAHIRRTNIIIYTHDITLRKDQQVSVYYYSCSIVSSVVRRAACKSRLSSPCCSRITLYVFNLVLSISIPLNVFYLLRLNGVHKYYYSITLYVLLKFDVSFSNCISSGHLQKRSPSCLQGGVDIFFFFVPPCVCDRSVKGKTPRTPHTPYSPPRRSICRLGPIPFFVEFDDLIMAWYL